MLHKIRIISATVLLLISANSFAQTSSDYKIVDAYVKGLGSLDTMNMGTISTILTKDFPDKENKARAIFDWIAYNINFDLKAAHNGDNTVNISDDILKVRKANSFGYAALFQDMCSAADIRCLTVNGYVKNTTDDINEKADEFNHSWDVVQLGTSQAEWFYVDPTWGSGFTDKAVKIFTKAFNDAYFFSNTSIFNLQHFPDNRAWQLGSGPNSAKEFFALPVVKNAAYDFGITDFTPASGSIKTKAGKEVTFNLTVYNKTDISTVSLLIGDDKKRKTKQVDYSLNGNKLSFNYKFEDEDNYPITIVINGKEVLDYVVDIE